MTEMTELPEPEQPNRSLTVWIVLSAIVIIGVGAWAFMNRDFSSDVAQAATAVTDAASAVREAVEPLMNDAEAPAQAEAPAKPAPAPAKAGPRRAAKVTEAAPDPVQPLAGPVTMVPSEGLDGSRVVSGSAPPPPPPDYRGAVFDASDTSVVPPSLMLPLSNAPLPRETLKPGQPLSIEILVNADGTVAAARVTSEPANMSETVQVVNALSIAKSWRFGPAMKAGQAVQYRMWVALDKVLMWRSNIKNERP